jgi:hypothetical protein
MRWELAFKILKEISSYPWELVGFKDFITLSISFFDEQLHLIFGKGFRCFTVNSISCRQKMIKGARATVFIINNYPQCSQYEYLHKQTSYQFYVKSACIKSESNEYRIFYKDTLKDEPLKVRHSIREYSSKNPCTSDTVTVNCTYLLSSFQCK